MFRGTIEQDDRSDESLLDLYAKTKDLDILATLYLRYLHLIQGICRNYFDQDEDLKDMVMACFTVLSRRLKPNEVNSFPHLLSSLVKNECISELRKRSVYKKHLEGFKLNQEQQVSHVENEAFERHIYDGLSPDQKDSLFHDVLKTLNQDQKLCVQLFYLEHKSYQEIANITGFHMKQVKSYLQNGKRNLRLKLEQQQNEGKFA